VTDPFLGKCSRCNREITANTAQEFIMKMDDERRVMLRVCQECDLLERREQHGRCGICHEQVVNEDALEHSICTECHPRLVAGDAAGLTADAGSRLHGLMTTIRLYERDNLERYRLVILPRR
jgi:hypothetical protein